eukprot:13717628-Ditylum_brightwellii.AAC.1
MNGTKNIRLDLGKIDMFLYPCGIYVGSFVGRIVGRRSCRLICHLVRCWGEALDKRGIGCLGYVRLPNSPISDTEVSPATMCIYNSALARYG